MNELREIALSKKINQSRWQLLAKELEKGALVIVPSASEVLRNHDVSYPFRQLSDFWYWTQFPEPDAIFVCFKKDDLLETILFCRPIDLKDQQWHGERIGLDRARQDYGFDHVFALNEFPHALDAWVSDASCLYTARPSHTVTSSYAQALQGWIAHTRLETKSFESLSHPMRLVKDDHEIGLMREAAQISVEAHSALMNQVEPGWYEFEAQAVLEAAMKRRGAKHLAYESIVASGQHACTLHYTANRSKMREGDLLLVDAGCEWGYYASDITRTYPVSGRFSGEQKAVYELVLNAQRSVVKALKPGVDWAQLQNIAVTTLTDGLIDLGILQGSLSDCLERQEYKAFYMHGIGHWLGLDVHDVGEKQSSGHMVSLQERMALTIEPGLYLTAQEGLDERWHNIGVRIEDNFIMTSDGAENLTQDLVKEVQDIEALMRR